MIEDAIACEIERLDFAILSWAAIRLDKMIRAELAANPVSEVSTEVHQRVRFLSVFEQFQRKRDCVMPKDTLFNPMVVKSRLGIAVDQRSHHVAGDMLHVPRHTHNTSKHLPDTTRVGSWLVILEGMPIEAVLLKLVSPLLNLVGQATKRRQAKRWVGAWEAHDVVGRDIGGRMHGAGPATVTLPAWKTSAKLYVDCYDCDDHGIPTRYQKGHIIIDPNDPDAATRTGWYTGTAEVYEQRLRLIDPNTILVIPVPGNSMLGNIYGKHAWRRKHLVAADSNNSK